MDPLIEEGSAYCPDPVDFTLRITAVVTRADGTVEPVIILEERKL